MGKRLAVFCSGQGTNLQALVDAVEQQRCGAELALVIVDRPDAPALERAQRHQIPSLLIEPRAFASTEAYEHALTAHLTQRQIDYVALAGFMRVLSGAFVDQFRWRILNIHPALLPAFKGERAVEDALAAGIKVTGVTVHFVTAEVDAGPIILQQAVPIADNETSASLLTKLHAVEHQLYPQAIQLLIEERLVVEGNIVNILPPNNVLGSRL